jgi:hypothetical protein
MKIQNGLVNSALLAAFLFSTTLVSQEIEDNPFEFKPEIDTSLPTQPVIVVDVDPELGDRQSKVVSEMIRQAIRALEMKDLGDMSSVIVEDQKYVLLNEGDRYVGTSSGMYVIFSKLKNDYTYFDIQVYAGTMQKTEYESIRQVAKEAAGEMVDSFSSLTVSDSETPDLGVNQSKIKPIRINKRN